MVVVWGRGKWGVTNKQTKFWLVKQDGVLEIRTTLYLQSTVLYCTLTHFVKRVDLVKVSYHSKINLLKKGI